MNTKGSSVQATLEHKEFVRKIMARLTDTLTQRAVTHDASKLEEPELTAFDEYTPKLAGCTFGSPEYMKYLEELKPALDHHYAVNRHHPQHFPNGVAGMDLLDILEMLVDWIASSARHNDGNIVQSLAINRERFDLDNVSIYTVLANTVKNFQERSI